MPPPDVRDAEGVDDTPTAHELFEWRDDHKCYGTEWTEPGEPEKRCRMCRLIDAVERLRTHPRRRR